MKVRTSLHISQKTVSMMGTDFNFLASEEDMKHLLF